jgi:uncharacterized hydrophobic protein (TIGR00271 family)
MDLNERVREPRPLFRSWMFFSEEPTPADEVLEAQTDGAVATLAFFILLALSTIIATNGLISDSAATVIGAMIIAPLMQPIGAMAYGLATTDRPLLVQATITMFSGVLFTVAVAYLSTQVVGVQTVGSEIVGRTAPTALDLVVAIAAGAAAAFAATRRSIGNAIPGVAIAVALVPPLCVVGVGLALGKSAIPEVGLVLNQNIALGALLLFLANLAGIIFSGVLVFVVQGYGRWSRALRGILIWLVVIAGLAFPLMFALQELLVRQTVHRHLVQLRYDQPDLYQQMVMRRLNVDLIGKTIYVDIEAISPQNLEFDVPAETERIRKYLSAKTGRVVDVKATVIRAEVIEARALPPLEAPRPDASR